MTFEDLEIGDWFQGCFDEGTIKGYFVKTSNYKTDKLNCFCIHSFDNKKYPVGVSYYAPNDEKIEFIATANLPTKYIKASYIKNHWGLIIITGIFFNNRDNPDGNSWLCFYAKNGSRFHIGKFYNDAVDGLVTLDKVGLDKAEVLRVYYPEAENEKPPEAFSMVDVI